MGTAIRLRGCAILLIFLLAALMVGFMYKTFVEQMKMSKSHDGVAHSFAKVVSSTNPSLTRFPSSSLNNNTSTDHENAVDNHMSAAGSHVGEFKSLNITTLSNSTLSALVPNASRMSHFVTIRSVESLRIAAFGSSKTWGSGLGHPSREVYVKVLSTTSRNLGIRGGQANYPSYCLHSMIGNEIFDVILLEFIPIPGENHDHFERLVKRLQRRLPAAILIYLHMPMPLTDVLYQGRPLREYIATRNLKSPQENPLELAATIRNISADLSWDTENVDLEAYHQTVRSAGGFMVVFPNMYETIQDTILKNIQYFGTKYTPWDFVHPNALGHRHAADKIRRELETFLATYDDKPPVQLPAAEITPDCKDSCIYWLDDPLALKEVQVANMTMGAMDYRRAKKYVLEVDRAGGSLSVDCSKLSPCNIYLLYVSFGPSKIYPRVHVSLNDQVDNQTLVVPHIPRFHIIKTAYVGTLVNTTRANLTVIPLPEDANSSHNCFRIAGVLMTPFYATTLEWN